MWMWTMNNNEFWIWGGTFESDLKNVWRAYLRILEKTKCITRQINLIVCKGAHFIQIHCFKGAHSTLSDIQFEGHIWGFYRGHILNPKSAKSRHLPDLRQKRVCYQSNVPPQTAMCPLPWEPWETLLRTGNVPFFYRFFYTRASLNSRNKLYLFGLSLWDCLYTEYEEKSDYDRIDRQQLQVVVVIIKIPIWSFQQCVFNPMETYNLKYECNMASSIFVKKMI